MSGKKMNQLNQPFSTYARKLENFLKYQKYDKDVCLLLGTIAGVSVRRHMELEDEIKRMIVELRLNSFTASALITKARTQLL